MIDMQYVQTNKKSKTQNNNSQTSYTNETNSPCIMEMRRQLKWELLDATKQQGQNALDKIIKSG